MTMLSSVQAFCKRTGLPSPATAAGTTDKQVAQVLAVFNEAGKDLAQRHTWQAMTHEATHTSLAAASQGTIASIATNGYDFIIDNTFWDRTQRIPICGPLSSEEWQAIQAQPETGPRYYYRLRGGLLLITPTPPAGSTFAFEYKSKNWVLAVDGTTYKDECTVDTDTLLLPDNLFIMALRWAWKKEKGLEYAEDFRMYEAQVEYQKAADKGAQTLQLDDCTPRRPRPGIFVSPGSWPVS